jgi:hypothetical protein
VTYARLYSPTWGYEPPARPYGPRQPFIIIIGVIIGDCVVPAAVIAAIGPCHLSPPGPSCTRLDATVATLVSPARACRGLGAGGREGGGTIRTTIAASERTRPRVREAQQVRSCTRRKEEACQHSGNRPFGIASRLAVKVDPDGTRRRLKAAARCPASGFYLVIADPDIMVDNLERLARQVKTRLFKLTFCQFRKIIPRLLYSCRCASEVRSTN